MTKTDYDIIDAHAHTGSYFQFPIRKNKIEEIVLTANSYGIKKMCVSSLFNFVYDTKEGNKFSLDAVKEYSDLFMFGGVLDPNESETEIEQKFRKIDEKVAMWNELHPALHKYPIDGKGYRIILDKINSNPKPVLFHTDESDEYSKPGKLEQLIKSYKSIPFIIGHSGNVIGGFEIAAALVKKYDNAFLDSTFSRNYYGIMKWMIRQVGAEKILFGSDIPFLNGAAQIGKLFEAGITDYDRQMIFHDNAARLLRLNKI